MKLGPKITYAAEPPAVETDLLFSLYNARRYAELENLAVSTLAKYPKFAVGWKLLGISQHMQGKDSLPALQKTVALAPTHADAHNSLGNVYLERKQFSNAAASYRRALKLQPEAVGARYNLGIALKNLGQFDDAAKCFRQALRVNPALVDAYIYLGNIYNESGQLEKAMENYNQALKLKPDNAAVHYNLGNLYNKLGQREDAIDSFRNAAALRPDYVEAHFNLGSILLDTGKLEEAERSFRKSLALKPDFVDALVNLGAALKGLDRFDEALDCYRKALEFKPGFAEVYGSMGSLLKECGRIDEARDCFQSALQIDPKCANALLGLDSLNVVNGDMAQAEESYLKTLEANPDDLDARIYLSRTRKSRPGDDNLAALLAAEQAMKDGSKPLSENRTMLLNFALGKCFDDQGEYDRAFPYFLEACRMNRARFDYDADQTTKRFDKTIRLFDRETLQRLRGAGNASDAPIFVLGMPRSGTTLTEQIIASHPDVFGAGEFPDLHRIAASMGDFPDNIAQLDHESLTRLGGEYVTGLLQRAPDARRITDKWLENFWYIGLIHLALPNAKIIHVNRNPVDTCLSAFSLYFTGAMPYTYDLAELGRFYSDYARLMTHWRNLLPPDAFLDVQYEDIVADQEKQARRIIDFCGLDWNDACLDFHENKRSVTTASMTQVRQPIYKSSVERWRAYEQHLGPLLDALGDLVPPKN